MKSKFLGKIQYIGAACLLLGGMSACTAGYEEMNTNPDKVTDDMLDRDNLRTGGSISAMQMDIIPCSDEGANAFQRAQNLVGDIFSGYMAASDNWNSSSNNQPPLRWMERRALLYRLPECHATVEKGFYRADQE